MPKFALIALSRDDCRKIVELLRKRINGDDGLDERNGDEDDIH